MAVAPSELEATPSTNSPVVHLTWTGATGAVHYIVDSQDESSDGEWVTVLPGKLSFASPSDPACYATVPGCGRSYAFRVAAVDANGHESAFSDPSPVVQTYNDPPVVSISAGSGNVTGTSVGLTASVSDDGLNDGFTETLTYAWSVTPPSGGDAWFDDDTSTTPNLYFTAAGGYYVTLTVDDGYPVSGVQSLTTQGLSVVVNHTLTSIDVTPGAAVVPLGKTRQLTATCIDQFDHSFSGLTLAWSIASGGLGGISQSGLYTAPTSGSLGLASVTAALGSTSGGVSVTVVNGYANFVGFEDLTSSDFDVVNGERQWTTGTTHYPGVEFSCPSGCYNVIADADWGANGDYAICTGPRNNVQNEGLSWNNPLYVDFDRPVNGLTFIEAAENTKPGEPSWNSSGHTFDVNIYQDGVYTTTLPFTGDTHYSTSTWGSHMIDLSAYQNITRIELVNITDPWGLWWDDFSFTPPPQLLDLTATDAAAPTNHLTATDAAIQDLYVRGDDNGTGHVNFDVEFDPLTFGSTGAGRYVHLLVVPNDPETGDPIFGSQSAVENQDLTNTHTFSNIALPTSGGYASYTAFAFMAQPGTYTQPPTGAPNWKRRSTCSTPGSWRTRTPRRRSDEPRPRKNNAPGAYVPLNNDDDGYDLYASSNGTKCDLDSTVVIPDEDDFLKVVLQPSGSGTYKLHVPQTLHVWQPDGNGRLNLVDANTSLSATAATTLYVEGVQRGVGTLSIDWAYGGVTNPNVDSLTVHVFEWKGALNVPDYSDYQYDAWGGDPVPGASGWLAPSGGDTDSALSKPSDTFSQSITVMWDDVTWDNGVPEVGKVVYRASPDFVLEHESERGWRYRDGPADSTEF